jgi:hypothetical protein
MTIEFAGVSIGIFLIVWVALIWKKLRVVEGRLALMQNDLKDLHIMESRNFHMILNAASQKKAPDTELSTSAPAAPVTQGAGGQASPVTPTTKKGVL